MTTSEIIDLVFTIFFIIWILKDNCNCDKGEEDVDEVEDIDYSYTEIERHEHSKLYFGIIDGHYIYRTTQSDYILQKEFNHKIDGFKNKGAAIRMLKDASDYFVSIENGPDSREYIDIDEPDVA